MNGPELADEARRITFDKNDTTSSYGSLPVALCICYITAFSARNPSDYHRYIASSSTVVSTPLWTLEYRTKTRFYGSKTNSKSFSEISLTFRVAALK